MLTLEQARELCPDIARLEQSHKRRVEELEAQLEWLKRQVWGAKSEKRAKEILNLGGQLWLGQELMPVPVDPPAKKTTVKEYERQQRKNAVEVVAEDSQLKFGPDVPVQTIEVNDPATADIPEEQRELLSENVVYRLAQRSPYVVLKYVTKTWKLKESGKIVTPRTPEAVIPGSSADVSFLAGLLVDKFQHHLPLYRQHERLTQAEVFLSRGTLTRQLHRVIQHLEPIYYALMSSTLQSALLAVDESPTPAGLKKGQGKEKGQIASGYLWAFYGSNDQIFFQYSPSRARKVIDETLSGYAGILLTDGYVAYESFCNGHPGVLHAQCWSHSRRNFIYAEKAGPQQCADVLQAIQQLYLYEREGPLGSDKLQEVRNKRSRPLVESLFTYLEKQIAESVFLPSNAFHKAAQYMLDRRAALEVFLDNPNVPLDTNHVERSIRPTVVGRKNWLFNFTETGARYAAIAYSLIQSCVIANVNPTVYLTDVLQRIAVHPARDVHLLTPRMWAQHFAENPMRSDAHG
jgi:transposase